MHDCLIIREMKYNLKHITGIMLQFLTACILVSCADENVNPAESSAVNNETEKSKAIDSKPSPEVTNEFLPPPPDFGDLTYSDIQNSSDYILGAPPSGYNLEISPSDANYDFAKLMFFASDTTFAGELYVFSDEDDYNDDAFLLCDKVFKTEPDGKTCCEGSGNECYILNYGTGSAGIVRCTN